MSDPNRNSVEQLFNAALELPTAAERRAYLDGACAGDAELRSRVEQLLRAHDTAGSFLDKPALDPGPTVLAGGETTGAVIGRYKILQLIGEGGFGSVYMAEQLEPVTRKVALKIIKLGMDTRQVIARFEAERQALALMDHPNIARVFDAGATESGRPYFVMELVKGIAVTEYCNQNKLSTRERLELFLQVCYAVQHAHQKGIIHRDIKPNNVLVTLHNSKPVPKVIDFGIAKATSQRLTDKTLFTEFRQLIGTPEYMSPDQAEISGLDVDTRTDIYSLGVLLYELLTGTTPFDAKTLRKAPYGEIQRIIREEEPPRPSTRVETLAAQGSGLLRHYTVEPTALSKLIRGDLDWIVMKAMEKDRTRRYDTANDLANDVLRHMRNEPVLAGPPSVIYKTGKFIRRHRFAVAAGTSILLAILIGFFVSTSFYLQARRERDAARLARAKADEEADRSQRIADFLQDLFLSTNPDHALSRDVDVARVARTAKEVFGNDHATVAATLSSSALQLQSAGELEAAEQLYNESLRLWRDIYGSNNINVGDTLRALGLLQITKGDDRAAEEALRESIRISRSLTVGETLTLSESLALLAGVVGNQNRFDEAIEMYRESIRIRRKIAPQQRLQIAVTNNALLNLLALAGYEEPMLEVVPTFIADWRAALPENSRLLARVLVEVGVLYSDHKRPEEAEKLLREAIAIFEAQPDPPPRFYVSAQIRLFDLLKHQNRIAEALDQAQRAIDFARTLDTESDLDAARGNFATVCWIIARDPKWSQSDYQAALNAVETFRREESVTPPAVINTHGVLLYRLGRYEEALKVLAESDEHYSKQKPGGYPHDVAFIAMSHYKLGRQDEARAALERFRQIMTASSFTGEEEAERFRAEVETLFGAAPPE